MSDDDREPIMSEDENNFPMSVTRLRIGSIHVKVRGGRASEMLKRTAERVVQAVNTDGRDIRVIEAKS